MPSGHTFVIADDHPLFRGALKEALAGIGDVAAIHEAGDFEVEVLLLSEVRGPAAAAQTLYRETDSSKEQRLKVAAERKAMKQFETLPAGRPSKRDRRRIIQFRGRV